MLIAVNFHYIRPSFSTPYEGIHGITPPEFEKQLTILTRCGEFVDARQIRAAVRGELDLPQQAIAVTFDDGLQEQYEYAWPVLSRLGIPAIFFVNTRPIAEQSVSTVHKIHLLRSETSPDDFLHLLQHKAGEHEINLDADVSNGYAEAQYPFDTKQIAELKYLLNCVLAVEERERLIASCFSTVYGDREAEISRSLYMTADQIQELGREAAIGSHGHDHLPLGLLPESQMQETVRSSVRHLQNWTGLKPFALSYPYGSIESCTPAVAEAAAAGGFEFAFTMERSGNDSDSFTRPFFLGRFDCNDMPGGKAAKWAPDKLFENIRPSGWYKNGRP